MISQAEKQVSGEAACLPFHLASFAGPRRVLAALKFTSLGWTYQHPFRLRRLGSGAPGLRGRGMAPQTRARGERKDKRGSNLPQVSTSRPAMQQYLISPSECNSRTTTAIGSLSAPAAVLPPSSDETIIDQTPTPSRQAHRGVGGRCARDEREAAGTAK
jgi:hypothetical protein